MYTYGARALRARAQSPKRKQKGCECKHVVMSQVAMFSRFKGLVSPFWLCTLLNPFLLPPFLSQMVCIRDIMPCTIRPHL